MAARKEAEAVREEGSRDKIYPSKHILSDLLFPTRPLIVHSL
jgi:hypothetical protein